MRCLCQLCYVVFDRSPALDPATPATHCPACAPLPRPVRELPALPTRVERERARRKRRGPEILRHPALCDGR